MKRAAGRTKDLVDLEELDEATGRDRTDPRDYFGQT